MSYGADPEFLPDPEGDDMSDIHRYYPDLGAGMMQDDLCGLYVRFTDHQQAIIEKNNQIADLEAKVETLTGDKQHAVALFALSAELGQPEFSSQHPTSYIREQIVELKAQLAKCRAALDVFRRLSLQLLDACEQAGVKEIRISKSITALAPAQPAGEKKTDPIKEARVVREVSSDGRMQCIDIDFSEQGGKE